MANQQRYDMSGRVIQGRLKVAEGGRVVIPAEVRRALGINAGDEVIWQVDQGEVRLYPVAYAIKRAQALVRQYVPAERSLADELIADRRATRCGHTAASHFSHASE